MTARRAPTHYLIAGRRLTAAEASVFVALATAPTGGVTIYHLAKVTGRTIRTVRRFTAERPDLVCYRISFNNWRFWSLSPAGRLMVDELRPARVSEAAE